MVCQASTKLGTAIIQLEGIQVELESAVYFPLYCNMSFLGKILLFIFWRAFFFFQVLLLKLLLKGGKTLKRLLFGYLAVVDVDLH